MCAAMECTLHIFTEYIRELLVKFCLIFQPSCGEDVTYDKVKNLKDNPGANHAVVFHGVLGWERREGRSPR